MDKTRNTSQVIHSILYKGPSEIADRGTLEKVAPMPKLSELVKNIFLINLKENISNITTTAFKSWKFWSKFKVLLFYVKLRI